MAEIAKEKKHKKFISFESTFTIMLILISFIGIILSNTIIPGFNEKFFCARYHQFNIGIVTHIFGHANWQHFINNVAFIAMLGPSIEDKYGTVYMAFMTLVTSLVTGLCTYFLGFGPIFAAGSYGLSTIVYMYIILNAFQSDDDGIPITSIILLLIWVLPEIISAFTTSDSIAHANHFMGAICGLLFGVLTKLLTSQKILNNN